MRVMGLNWRGLEMKITKGQTDRLLTQTFKHYPCMFNITRLEIGIGVEFDTGGNPTKYVYILAPIIKIRMGKFTKTKEVKYSKEGK